jgi:hypothetical protein
MTVYKATAYWHAVDWGNRVQKTQNATPLTFFITVVLTINTHPN